MSLIRLELLPRGEAGWTSPSLVFGEATTVLLGANGSGKTPVIKALAYALGHPVSLPRVVRQKCRAVALELTANLQTFRVERRLLESGLDATVTDPDGRRTSFNEERSFSEWILPKLGISLRALTGKGDDKIAPYVSVVGPMFLVDQDKGWTTTYVPIGTSTFIKDQREEVLRWLLEVPAKHRPIDKDEYREAKVELAGIQEVIAFKRRGLEKLQRELGEDAGSNARSHLQVRREILERSVSRAEAVIEAMSSTESELDERVREAIQQRDVVRRSMENAKRRKAQLAEVQAEVGVELGALEQNEVASGAFRALCGNEACQFFRRPEASYGRRVLYLKDQLKDFESSSGETERQLRILQAQLLSAEHAVTTAVQYRKESIERAGGGEAVASIEAASLELGDVRVRLDRLERIGREQEQLEALINREARAQEAVAELRPRSGPRRDTARLLDARQHLAAATREWLLTLQAPNIPEDVVYDESLRLVVDGESFSAKSSHSGSTRTRLVLAQHAAIVEVSLKMGGSHPRLLVLDAPRQQELEAEDLRAFISRFHRMSLDQAEPIQLVFSASEADVVPRDSVDALWQPGYEFDELPRLRFLGPPTTLARPEPGSPD